MPGITGPIPKRSDERIRANKPEIPVDKVSVIGEVEIPDLGLPNPHPLVRDMYESLKASGQSRFYEPSDWAFARFTLHFCNKILRKRDPSAMMLASVNQMLSLLLMTEGDRRRVRLEVERNQAKENVVVDVSDMFRQRFAKTDQALEGLKDESASG